MTTEYDQPPISFNSFKTSNFQAINTYRSMQQSFHFFDNEVKEGSLRSALTTPANADVIYNKVFLLTRQFRFDKE